MVSSAGTCAGTVCRFTTLLAGQEPRQPHDWGGGALLRLCSGPRACRGAVPPPFSDKSTSPEVSALTDRPWVPVGPSRVRRPTRRQPAHAIRGGLRCHRSDGNCSGIHPGLSNAFSDEDRHKRAYHPFRPSRLAPSAETPRPAPPRPLPTRSGPPTSGAGRNRTVLALFASVFAGRVQFIEHAGNHLNSLKNKRLRRYGSVEGPQPCLKN